jgi:copper(I)-binding protein
MRNRTIGNFRGARSRACAAGLRQILLFFFVIVGLPGAAPAQSTPEELAAAGLRVQAVRYNVNASGDGMVWFRLTNKSGANWHVASIRCEIYDRGGALIFEQTFRTSLMVDANTTMRETEGFVVNKFPRDFKSGCFIDKATRR